MVDYTGVTSSLPFFAGLGYSHSCAIHDDATVSCWGDNRNGAANSAADIAFTPSSFATPITTPDRIRGGDGFTCLSGLAAGTGQVACWGRNDRGQLGDPAYTDAIRRTPLLVPGLTAVTEHGVGLAHVCAIGTMSGMTGVWCWGANGQGQLGDGTLVDRRTPVRVNIPLLAGEFVLEVGAGEAHTCARVSTDLTGDLGVGRIFCWGRNAEGQVGDGTFGGDTVIVPPAPDADMGVATMEPTTSCRLPKLIPGITTAAGLRVGRRHNCAGIATGGGGEVRCWGLNAHGQVGDNSVTNRATPVTVINYPSIDQIVDLAAGGAHSCVVTGTTGTGTLTCWGRNDAAQLGNLGTTDSLIPIAVATTQANTIERVSAGIDSTCVLVQQTVGPARAIRCWGGNEYGQTSIRGFRANRVALGGVRFAP